MDGYIIEINQIAMVVVSLFSFRKIMKQNNGGRGDKYIIILNTICKRYALCILHRNIQLL